MTKYDLNLRDYWRVIQKRKFIVIFTFLAMVVFSFLSAILTSPTPLYKTNATITFERTNAAAGLYEQMMLSSSGNIETEAAVIKSFHMQELVAKKLGLIPKDATPEMVRNNAQYIRIILDLKDKVQTELDSASNLINITVTSTDPKLAQTLANTIAQVYRDEHAIMLNRRATDTRKFIESQVVIARDKLAKSEEDVKTFREKNKFITAEGEASGLSAQLSNLQTAYDRDASLYQQVLQMSRYLKGAEDRHLSSDKVFSFSGAAPTYDTLNDRLVQLMLQRDMLLLSYTDNFPQVKELKEQIREVLRSMGSQLSAQERNLAAGVGLLKRQIRETKEKLRMMPGKGLEMARLERNVGVDKEVYILLEKKYQEALIQEAVKIEEVQIVKPALEPTAPINATKTGVNTILGMIIGLILGVVFAFLIETFDTSIGAIEEIEAFMETRVLGIIPFLKLDDVRTALRSELSEEISEENLRRQFRLISHFMPTSTLAENYRALRTNFNFLTVEKDIKTVVFTSTYPEEGKTSVTCNLAIAMAQTGRKVLLIDGDFRRPVIARVFGLENTPGFTDVILGNYERKSVVRSITDLMMGKLSVEDITKTPGLDNLYILTSGTNAPNPAELIGSRSVAEMIRMFRAEYDVVLIDAPPVLAATDATIWSGMADGVILVYQVGRAARGALKRARAQLDNVKAHIMGIVLNGLKAEISPDFTYHDKYDYYYGGYGHGKKRKKTFWQKTFSFFTESKIQAAIEAFLEKKKAKKVVDKGTLEENIPETEIKQEILPEIPSTPSEQPETTKKSMIRKLILILALIFLILGVLFQMGYLSIDSFMKKSDFGEKQTLSSPPRAKAPQPAQKAPVTTPQDKAQVRPPIIPPQKEKERDLPKEKSDAGNYTIQVASLFDPAEVRTVADQFQKMGIDVSVEKVHIPEKGLYHRMLIGCFFDKQQALAFLNQKGIRRLYPGSLIRKVPSADQKKERDL